MSARKNLVLGLVAAVSVCHAGQFAVSPVAKNAVVLKAARVEIRVEDGRITSLRGPDGMTVNAGTGERADRVGLGVMGDPGRVTLAHQPFVMPTIKRCNKSVASAATMWRRPCEKSAFCVRETSGGALLLWKGLSDGKEFYPDDELSLEFGTDGNGAMTMKTRGRSPKGGVFCVQTPVEDVAGANALVMPIMGGQRYRVDEMQKSAWSATADCMRYDAPLVAIETAKGAFGLWSEDATFRNFAAYFPKQDETASFAFEFMNVMPFETKTEAESPVVKIDAFPGCDWLGASRSYHDWYRRQFASELALRDGTWGDEINVMVTTSMDRYMLFDDHLDTLTNLFGKGVLFNFFKMTQESTKTKKFDWELPGHTPDLDFLPAVRARHRRGIRCSCYMVAHCVNYNSKAFRRDHLERIALPTLTNPYGYRAHDKLPKGTPEEKWKALNLKDTALVYCDMNSKAWRDYIHDVHKKCFGALELDTIYEDCLGVIRDVGNGETDGTTGSYGVYLHARELQREMALPFLGEFGPAPVAMIEKFPLVSADAYRDELDYLNYRLHHTLPMSSYLFGYRPWGTGSEHERSEYHRFLGAALSDATGGLGFVSVPPWNMESGINDHMALRSKVFADNALKPYFPEGGCLPPGTVSMYRGKDGGLFRYTDDGKVQVMWGPDGKPLYGRVSLATEFDVPGLELPGWPMRKGSRHYGLKPENLYTLFPAKAAAANPFGDITETEKLVLAYDTPEYTYLELAGKAPKVTFKVKESAPLLMRSVQASTGLELKGDAVALTNGAPTRLADNLTLYMVKPAGFRTLDFVHTVKPGEAFRVDTQNREWGTQLSNGSRVDVLVNGVRQCGYDVAEKPNPRHENKFKRWLFDYRFHRYTVPLDKWVGKTVLLSVRIDEKNNSYDDRQRLALPKIVKYNGEPLEAIVPGMVPAAAWERFNGGEPPHEGDDATYPKKAGKTEQGVKAVGELNNGL